jgi:hypothetical protein
MSIFSRSVSTFALFFAFLTFTVGLRAQQDPEQYQNFKNDHPKQPWICYAEGRLDMGPGGYIPETVTGEGATKTEAQVDARDNCYDRGLEMCLVGDCHRQ